MLGLVLICFLELPRSIEKVLRCSAVFTESCVLFAHMFGELVAEPAGALALRLDDARQEHLREKEEG